MSLVLLFDNFTFSQGFHTTAVSTHGSCGRGGSCSTLLNMDITSSWCFRRNRTAGNERTRGTSDNAFVACEGGWGSCRWSIGKNYRWQGRSCRDCRRLNSGSNGRIGVGSVGLPRRAVRRIQFVGKSIGRTSFAASCSVFSVLGDCLAVRKMSEE